MRPVASSSRPVRRRRASTPSLTSIPTPTPPSAPARLHTPRATTVAFVLALTAPYLAAASPLPYSGHAHDPHPPAAAERDTTWAEAAIVGTLSLLQTTVKGLLRGRTPGEQHAPPNRRWPQLGAARFDVTQQLYRLPEGYVALHQTMTPGFVVLSYFISLVGALCTLELLIRRTSNRGITNVLLLASAGICFGAVSTFAMHFVGNQSLALHHPAQRDDPSYPDIYLSYQGGYTVLSLVASCLAMTFAFFVMGTDIRLSQWKQWWYSSGESSASRESKLRRTSTSTISGWRTSKVKSASIATIFHQAGMVPSWSLDTPNRRHSAGGWRDLVAWRPGRRPSTPMPPRTFEAADVDEDTLIQQDKDLSELEFRHGRLAVRDEIDRRALQVGTPQPPREEGSPVSPFHSQQLPSSPLESYYPSGPQHEPPAYRSPSPAFDPGYSFPPRDPRDSRTNLLSASTSNLLSPHELAPPPPASFGLSAAGLNGLPPAILQGGRRASLPIIAPPFAPRVAQTLSRIQSLPEPDPDVPTPSRAKRASTSKRAKDSQAQQTSSSGTTSSSSEAATGTTGTTGDEDDAEALYNEGGHFKIRDVGWRERLRFKIQAGLPLTRLERAQRFLGLDVVTWTEVAKIFVTGMVAGWGVAAMHYIGQVSINDIPYIAYKVGYVVGSVIIASGAVIIALYIMFIMLRPKLKHSWVSKIIVAIILAGAVCGMHYTGMRGTIYGWEADRRPSGSTSMSGTKRAITGIVAALAFVACLGVMTFIVTNSMRDRKEKARRRRVVVASVILDDQDRMLVSAIDGLLPMCDIASLTPGDEPSKKRALTDSSSSSNESGLGLDLNTHNEAFLQAMKMSWSWRNPFWSSLNPFATASDIVGANGLELAPSPQPAAPTPLKSPPPTPYMHRGSIATNGTTSAISISGMTVMTRLNIARFLEKFAVSATQLSVRLTGKQDGLNRLGVLYDKILTTGWVRLRNGKDTVSNGQLIFLVRRVVSDEERSDLLSRHFIFADTSSVATSLHKTLSAEFDTVLSFLDDMRRFTDHTMRMSLRPNTLYSGVAVVQATPFDGLRILLNGEDRSQLPMREVCTFSTLPGLPVDVADGLAGTLQEIGEAVTWLDGMSLLSVITRNMSPEGLPPRVARLLVALEKAVVPLLDDLLSQDDMAYILPRLTLHPVLVPLTPASPPRAGSPGWAAPHIIVFYANYDVAVCSFSEQWHPFPLFRAQNGCVMAGAIDRISRAAAAPPRTSADAPGMSPNMNMYVRRPSKVQFEEPSPFGSFAFPPRSDEWSPLAASRERQPPRRSSLSKPSAPAPGPPDLDATANNGGGVATWDPHWLISLLRARLRADA